jgi:hypothetical protein
VGHAATSLSLCSEPNRTRRSSVKEWAPVNWLACRAGWDRVVQRSAHVSYSGPALEPTVRCALGVAVAVRIVRRPRVIGSMLVDLFQCHNASDVLDRSLGHLRIRMAAEQTMPYQRMVFVWQSRRSR